MGKYVRKNYKIYTYNCEIELKENNGNYLGYYKTYSTLYSCKKNGNINCEYFGCCVNREKRDNIMHLAHRIISKLIKC